MRTPRFREAFPPFLPADRTRRSVRTCLVLAVVLLGIAAGSEAAALAGPGRGLSGRALRAEIRFGAEMAERGLWREAIFRWRRALEARPRDPKLLNNIAVALEAMGRTEEALETYALALDVAGGDDPNIRANLERARWAVEGAKEKQGRDGHPAAGEAR